MSRRPVDYLLENPRARRASGWFGASKNREISFERIVTAGFALALVGLAAISLVAFRSIEKLANEAGQVKQTQEALTRLSALLSTMTDAETGQRGFTITGDERFLEPYRTALTNYAIELRELRRLTADNPARQRQLDALAPLLEARLATSTMMIDLRRTQGFEAARRETATASGKEAQDEIRRRVAEMFATEEGLLRQREAQTAVAARASQTVIIGGSGLAIAVVALALLRLRHDIAARWRVEIQLRKLNEELSVARDRAEVADRLKSAFLATMSHELRTPLNSIIGFTGIILRGLAGPLNAEQRKQLGMVQGSARHLLALINDVLDISKIEAGELKVIIAPFDARAVIGRVVDALRPMAEAKRLALRAEVAPEIGEMVSDVRRVEQILLNLLNNAVKFTERGEVTLRAAVEDGRLRVSVADTGIGIEPQDVEDIFRPFQQVDAGLTRAHEGTGLGLAISRRLAGLLRGEIHAASEWGKGSTFTVTLPLRAAEGKKDADAIRSVQGP